MKVGDKLSKDAVLIMDASFDEYNNSSDRESDDSQALPALFSSDSE
jgi:hypothetical protein